MTPLFCLNVRKTLVSFSRLKWLCKLVYSCRFQKLLNRCPSRVWKVLYGGFVIFMK